MQNAPALMIVETYHALGESGAIDERTELLHGLILPKKPKPPRHCLVCARLEDALRAASREGLYTRQHKPVTCGFDSEPVPDIAVVRGDLEDFAHKHPETAALVVEVSISTLERDLEKAGIYAAAGVDEYWLIRPEKYVADIYTLPGPDGYQSRRRVERDGTLSPAILPQVTIRLEELLA